MKICRNPFNIYFLCLGLVVTPFTAGAAESPKGGAQTNESAKVADPKAKPKKRKKETVTIRVHVEALVGGTTPGTPVTVLRSNPMVVNVEKDPVVDESRLEEARLIDGPGGPEIELQFDSQGRTMLGNYTAAHRGQRLAIYSDFGKDHRWLAAPVITRIASNGTIRFSPDATLDEAQRIVENLNRQAGVSKKKKDDW
ncbi:MAG TPA: hypothetical protein DCM86_12980 [Verrucomicrobiales bacterium]|nr:hypothetical protein [Verrucomicrobiales bacterium]